MSVNDDESKIFETDKLHQVSFDAKEVGDVRKMK